MTTKKALYQIRDVEKKRERSELILFPQKSHFEALKLYLPETHLILFPSYFMLVIFSHLFFCFLSLFGEVNKAKAI